MKFTKILSLILAIIMIMSMFVACNSSSRDDDDDEDEETKKEKTESVETTVKPVDTTKEADTTTDSTEPTVPTDTTDTGSADITTDSAADPSDTTKPEDDITDPLPPEEPEYKITYLDSASEGLILFYTDQKQYGFMDLNGNVVIEPEFEWADVFSNGRANVAKEVDGKFRYGYIDRTGNVVIDYLYDLNVAFDSTIVRLEKDRVGMFVDLNGNVIYTETGDEVEIGKVSNGWFWVETVKSTLAGDTHYMTYYNEKGKAFTVDNAWSYSNHYYGGPAAQSNMNEWGYAVVSVPSGKDDPQNIIIDSTGKKPDWLYGLVDRNTYITVVYTDGNYVKLDTLEENFVAFVDFENKTAAVAAFPTLHRDLGNGYFYEYIDEECKIIKDDKVLLNVSAIEAFKPAEVTDVEYAYLDGKDYFVISLRNASGTGFQAVIDSKGNVVIDPTNEYTIQVPYHGANFLTIYKYFDYNRKYGIIDLTGKILIEPTYSDTAINEMCTYNGVTAIVLNNGTTLIDINGNVIFNVEK